MIGRRLEGPELVGYDHVDMSLLAEVRVVRVPILAPGAAGMTIGRHVLLLDDSDRRGRSMLMAHELVHVRQFAEAGLIGFLRTYLASYFRGLARLRSHRAAYLAIPAEQQARHEAAAWADNFG